VRAAVGRGVVVVVVGENLLEMLAGRVHALAKVCPGISSVVYEVETL
jgi:hypothetical protein